MPRFSIVIPTRQRADTLAFTIETALAQTHPDFEVVIQNNGDDPPTRDVVASFESPRIKLTCSADILPMAENWEAALAASSGEYIAFIGDDDGIMPDACAICDAVMQHRPSLGALQWTPHYYDWPTSLRAAARNRLVVNLPGLTEGALCPSRDLLLQLYDGTLTWTSMPLIYNGAFVRRSVIDKVRSFCAGRYFAGQIPDVHSGIANLWAMRQFLHIDRPLSICGASGHSNGNAHFVGNGGTRLQQRFHAENPALHQTIADCFLDTTNMELTIATALVVGKQVFFNDDPTISINMRNVLLRMGLSANRDPTLYDRTIREMRQMGQKFGIDTSSFNLPPKRQVSDLPFQGPVIDASGRTTCLAVDGAMARLETIADAVRLAASMLPLRTPAQLNAALPWPEAESSMPPHVAAELAELAPLLAIQPNAEAAERYFRLTEATVCAHRADIHAHARLLQCQTTELGVCQIPATPRGRPTAVFIPDVLTPLPDAAARAIPFFTRFDLAVCEWPGHGASGETADVALPALAAELAALVDRLVPDGQTLFVIGESIGGLPALALARLRPRQVRNVILIDTPFHLTRPALAADIASAWRRSSMSPYLRRLLRDLIGFDPEDRQPVSTIMRHALLQEAPFNCALIPGGVGAQHATPSVLLDEDLAALSAAHPPLLRTGRITRAGHHVLRDDPQGMLEELNKLLVRA